MAIALSAEQEKVIDRGIEAGMVSNAEIALEVGIAMIRQQLAMQSHSSTLSKEERKKAFRDWIDGHPADTPSLSDEAISRESIYADRGL
jgi:hypothetical protein